MISFMIHIALIFFTLYNFHPNDMGIGTSQVYAVTVVTDVHLGGIVESKEDSSLQNRKDFLNQNISLGDVEKEQPFDYSNSDKDNDNSEPKTGTSSPFQGQTVAVNYASGSGGEPFEISLWKTRARSMVEISWQSPDKNKSFNTPPQVTYLLTVSRTGEVLEKKLLVSSGNEPFDQSVLIALDKVTRFPPPPLILIAGEDQVSVTISFMPPQGTNPNHFTIRYN